MTPTCRENLSMYEYNLASKNPPHAILIAGGYTGRLFRHFVYMNVVNFRGIRIGLTQQISVLVMLLVFLSYASIGVAQIHDQSTAPWDYRDREYADDLAVVEKHHFNMNVQTLKAGQSTAYVGGDLAFIFRFFPNHHRALDAMGRLWRTHRRTSNRAPPGMDPSRNAEYFFEQAIAFAPSDGTVEMLYGMHLFLSARNDQALPHVNKAVELAPNSPEINYNAGLFFLAMGNHEIAMSHARTAYDAGYPLPGLRKKLVKIGAWKESN